MLSKSSKNVTVRQSTTETTIDTNIANQISDAPAEAARLLAETSQKQLTNTEVLCVVNLLTSSNLTALPKLDPSTDEDQQNTVLQVNNSVNTKAVALLQEENFKVCCSLGVGTLFSHAAILDTGCGPCLIDRLIMQSDWELHCKPVAINLRSVNKTILQVVGVVPLKLRLGDLTRSVTFGMVDGLAVPIIIGIAYQKKSIDAIFPKKMLIQPEDSRPITISQKYNAYDDAPTVRTKDPPLKPSTQLVHLSKQCILPPMSQTAVKVKTNAAGLFTIVLSSSKYVQRMKLWWPTASWT